MQVNLTGMAVLASAAPAISPSSFWLRQSSFCLRDQSPLVAILHQKRMAQTQKKTVSDWTVITLGTIGLLLGISGLMFPESQYEILGVDTDSIGPIIPGLMGSAGLSATCVGLMYIFGTIQRWKFFKHYLIFARMIMAIGFVTLVSIDRAPATYVSAALWEGIGAVIIALALWWDSWKTKTSNE
jgi:hypothetical protein